jgi:galactose mutarotase-like enzyme
VATADHGRSGTVRLESGRASAELSLTGAEPLSWRVGGRELLWHGDPAHWERRAPLLFPVVGASAGGRVRVGHQDYPMPRHGFARDALFTVRERAADSVRLQLKETDESWAHYPFRFVLDVTAVLTEASLALGVEVRNADTSDMPYAFGFHPAFPWPFDGGAREDYAVAFECPERPEVPEITAEGLIASRCRPVPCDGSSLPLDPALFQEALCFLNAHSQSLRFLAPTGAAIELTVENVPHFALWTKPDAPFLSLEAWTGHADPEGFEGELSERPSMIQLPMGHTMRHLVTLTWHEADGPPA